MVGGTARHPRARAALTPAKVECTEAHGTGTALGEPTEAGALRPVLGLLLWSRDTPRTLGAAKATVGHSEGRGV
jgi:acyl transferase domain-containing protein